MPLLRAHGTDVLPVRRLEIRCAGAQGPALGGDVLSAEGIEEAYRLGRSLRIGYTHLFSSGSQRATQTIACMLAGMGRHVLNGVAVWTDLGHAQERDRKSATAAPRSASLSAALQTDEPLARTEAERLAASVRSMLASLPEGSYALAVTDDFLAECAAYGLTGEVPAPLKECEGFLVAELPGGRLTVERLRRPTA